MVWSSLRWWGKGQKDRPAFMDAPEWRSDWALRHRSVPGSTEEARRVGSGRAKSRMSPFLFMGMVEPALVGQGPERSSGVHGRAEWRSDWALRHRSVPRSTEEGQSE